MLQGEVFWNAVSTNVRQKQKKVPGYEGKW